MKILSCKNIELLNNKMSTEEDKKKQEEKDKKKKEEEEEEKDKIRRKELENNREREYSTTSYAFVMFIVILLWIWFIAGLLAFIVSLVCFGFNGYINDKFLGLVLALTIGPLYWLYFIYNNNYCTTRPL